MTSPSSAPTPGAAAAPCVYYDGGCPLCSREIATYRAARGGQALQWVDAQASAGAELGPALTREDALRRLHVRLPDGQLVSGAAAFVAIWQRLPAFSALAWLARVPGMLWVMEGAYRAFLRLRVLWRAAPSASTPAASLAPSVAAAPDRAAALAYSPAVAPAVATAVAPASTDVPAPAQAPAFPAALRRELRTDHAGEAGAVMIYRGVLAVARDAEVRAFAQHHLATEARHLALIEGVVPPAGRSRLLPLWRVAGWFTGVLPACLGPGAVYATIEAVETFVDRHYAEQLDLIDALLPAADAPAQERLRALRALLAACQQDELAHRDDARARRGPATRGGPAAWAARAWAAVVGAGSAGAVRVSRWV